MIRRNATVGAFLVLATGTAAAQSIVRPVPRVATHELASLSIAPDLGFGPRSEWDVYGPQLEDQAQDGLAVALVGTLEFHPDAQLSNAAGEVATQRAAWDMVLGSSSRSGGLFAVDLKTEASFYDFGGTAGLVPGAPDPFNDLYSTRLGATIYTPMADRLHLFNGVEITLAGEDQVGILDGATIGGATGFAYRASDELELSVGLAGASRLEDDAYVLPFLGIDWQATSSTRLVAEGPELRLEQDLSETVEMTLSAVYDLRQFRLNEGGALDKGVFRDEQIAMGASLSWRPDAGVQLRVGGGYTLWRELTFFDRDGIQLGQSEMDPAPYVSMSLSLTF